MGNGNVFGNQPVGMGGFNIGGQSSAMGFGNTFANDHVATSVIRSPLIGGQGDNFKTSQGNGMGGHNFQGMQSAPSGAMSHGAGFSSGHDGMGGPRRMDEYSKIYEEKTAQSNQGDGSPETGPAWMRWTRLYLIGNAPDAEAMLNAAEMAQRPITMQDVASLGGATRMNVDPVVLSGHIWRYLNQATTKSARSIFENLEARNGMEAWRRLYRHIHKGSLLQKHTLGLKIQSPAAYLKEAGNLAIGIDKWEQDIRDYVAAGGQYPAEDTMVMNLCSSLPGTLRSNLIW